MHCVVWHFFALKKENLKSLCENNKEFVCTDKSNQIYKSANLISYELNEIIAPLAMKSEIVEFQFKIEFIVLEKPSLHAKRKVFHLASIEENKEILQMQFQNTRKDYKELASIESAALIPLNLPILM